MTIEKTHMLFVRYTSWIIPERPAILQKHNWKRKDSNLFQILDKFITENDLDWEEWIRLCTNEARSLSGSETELQTLIRSKTPYCMWTHYIIDTNTIAMSSQLKLIYYYCSRYLSRGNVVSCPFSWDSNLPGSKTLSVLKFYQNSLRSKKRL